MNQWQGLTDAEITELSPEEFRARVDPRGELWDQEGAAYLAYEVGNLSPMPVPLPPKKKKPSRAKLGFYVGERGRPVSGGLPGLGKRR